MTLKECYLALIFVHNAISVKCVTENNRENKAEIESENRNWDEFSFDNFKTFLKSSE